MISVTCLNSVIKGVFELAYKSHYTSSEIGRFWSRAVMCGRGENARFELETYNEYGNPIFDNQSTSKANLSRHNPTIKKAFYLIDKFNKTGKQYYINKILELSNMSNGLLEVEI